MDHAFGFGWQPPSGGCVLKPDNVKDTHAQALAAAFRRLCIETILLQHYIQKERAAAFRRLCIETRQWGHVIHSVIPAAAFRRLCIETLFPLYSQANCFGSRLQAAVY